MTSSFEFDYFVCSFIASVSVLQLAFTKAIITNLIFYAHGKTTVTVCLSALFMSFILFFTTENRNVNDFAGGMDANQQALTFLASTIAAFLFTGGICSFKLLNQRQIHSSQEDIGLESLKTITLANLYRTKWNTLKRSISHYLR